MAASSAPGRIDLSVFSGTTPWPITETYSSDVFDALVIGIQDDRFGAQVAAVVAPREGVELDLAVLDEHVRTKLAGYKAPRGYWIVEQVMRQPSGKANYPAAKKYAADNWERVRPPR